MTKINAIHVANFRGIVGELRVDLTKNGKPVAALLLGDNGCGKSSILDAIGFCLRGQTYRAGSGGYGTPTLRNLISAGSEPSFVTVDLDSGEEVTRRVEPGERHYHDKPAHQAFRYSNFLITRRDLLRFTELPTRDRSSYLARFGGIPLLAETRQEVRELQVELNKLEEAKMDLESQLIRVTDSDENHFPRTHKKFGEWVYRLRGGTPHLSKKERRGLPQLEPNIATLVQRLDSLYLEIAALKRKIHSMNTGRNKDVLSAQFEIVGANVTAAFLKLCPQNLLVRRFVFLAPDSSSPRVSLKVDLPSGYTVSPNNILSEASLDLLALLTYIYLIKAAASHGQAQVIVLDDVFSSVDTTVRAKIAQHLFDEFRDWQLIMSFHDRLWYEQFRRVASSVGVDHLAFEFGRWQPASGPTLYQSPQDASANLRKYIRAMEPDRLTIAASAGMLVETICDFLTVNLGLPLPRRLNQLYNIGEMWPALAKLLGRSSISQYVTPVSRMVHLRNLSSHNVEWAVNLSLDEALDFAQSAIDLWEHVFCDICRSYVSRNGTTLQCTCGAVIVNML